MKEGINAGWGAWWCAGLGVVAGAVVALGLAWFWPEQLGTPAMIAVQTWFLATLAVLGCEAVVLVGRERDKGSGPAVGPDYRARNWPHLYLPGVVLILSGLDGCWRLGQAETPSFMLVFAPWMVAVVEATLVVLLALALRHRADLLTSKVGSPQDPEKPSPNNSVPKQDPIPESDPKGLLDLWNQVAKESPLSGESDTGTASHSAWRRQNENQP